MQVLLPFILVFILNVFARHNVILILTDDQDLILNSMVALKNVQNLIGNKGVTFKNAFVNTPICCPSRSTILTGKYLHNTSVYNNSLEGNCSSSAWQKKHEPLSMASILKQNGYVTFYAGKYLNQYGEKDAGGIEHVPVGYDWWLGLKGNSKYYNYTLSINGTANSCGNRYLTDVMNDFALKFLNQGLVRSNPFFMILSTPAAHAPFTPASRHKNAFLDINVVRTPSFNYTGNDKHWLINMPPHSLPTKIDILDNIHRHRLQTLLAVDEMVENIILKLNSLKLLEKTYIIFTSDNGYHIGQFGQLWDKRQPYETDIRVPLLIRGPKIKEKFLTEIPVSAVDIAPTVLNMADINTPSYMDGTSFLNEILLQSSESNREIKERNILIEYFGEGDDSHSVDKTCPWIYDSNVKECRVEAWCKCQDSRNNTYTCVRRVSNSVDFKYCEFKDNLKYVEAYNLKVDPYELHNIYKTMQSEIVQDYQATLNKLLNCKGQSCVL